MARGRPRRKTQVRKLAQPSTVYGPVRSWRVGLSLGVDLLFVNSVCSFKCNYCQLGKINLQTLERRVYVPTERVLADLRASRWREADVVTFSGSGEPTLAANLGDAIGRVKTLTGKPVAVLTNASTLNRADVRRDLRAADSVFCKLDAVDDHALKIINRPLAGITSRSIVEGIKSLREEYAGRLCVQTMLQRRPGHADVLRLARLLKEIGPDEVQLNAPLRPVPRAWCLDARGNDSTSAPAVTPKPIRREEAARVQALLGDLTGLKIVSVYGPEAAV